MTDASPTAKAEKLKSRQEDGALVLRLDEVRPNRQAVVTKREAPVPSRPLPLAPAKPSRKTRVTYKSEKMTGIVAKAKGGISGGMLSFFLLVALPTIAAGLYYAFVATPQYISEFRFSVRPSEGAAIGGVSMSGEAAIAMSNSYIVSDYAVSRDVVEALEKQIDLRGMYSAEYVDYISRLSPNVSLERLVKYWENKIITSYDMTTGINTIEVSAFSPDDAHRIAATLQSLCEKLVNDLSEKARQSQVAFSQKELQRSEDRLKEVRRQETELRTGQKSIDARKEADGKIQLSNSLRSTLSAQKSQYTALSSYMDPTSPRLTVLTSQIDATQAELDRLQAQISATGETASSSMLADAQLMTRYDQLQSDIEIATKLYQSSLTNFENARMLANNNLSYLATYVQPGIPQVSSYPRVFIDTFLVFLSAVGIWVVLTLIFYSIRDHA